MSPAGHVDRFALQYGEGKHKICPKADVQHL